ncbi:hypothetical protein C5167_034281 [Papaver somniferum]|uniref:Uncharacterized protein n=1 Tax=Papaver somniferum TaxID=3469 RepID=A0A4Y7KG06_PAPSO|nr:hypothetical protein C5167_034281 [Papaver somniferum]
MASGVIAPPQRKRDGVVAGIPKPKAPERNNRRALRDVGNLVIRGVYGKSQQVSRPVTRGFSAQACNVEINNKKKPVFGDGVAVVPKRKLTNKPPQKEVVVVKKPKPETVVIEISLDAEEGNKEKPGTQKSSVKDVQISTSVLSASSQVPSGLVDKTKKTQIVDIDAGDVDIQLAAVEYVKDLYHFYKMAESSIQIHDYMGSQNQINENVRMILVDWLTEVHHVYKLSPETLYLTVQIIDRYLSTRLVHMKELQLLGISSMLLASKYVDIWEPMVNHLVCVSERAYSKEHILGMKKSILAKLGWSLSGPTPYVFLVRFVKAAMADKEMENMAFFLTELGLLHYGMLKFCPSMLAASAVYAARCNLNKTPHWDETLNFHTGYSESQLIECAKQLVSFHSQSAEVKPNSVYRKYSASEVCSVALLAPAKML